MQMTNPLCSVVYSLSHIQTRPFCALVSPQTPSRMDENGQQRKKWNKNKFEIKKKLYIKKAHTYTETETEIHREREGTNRK